jgi:hypothetical protein
MFGQLEPVSAGDRNIGVLPHRITASKALPRRRTSTSISPWRSGRRSPVGPVMVPLSTSDLISA